MDKLQISETTNPQITAKDLDAILDKLSSRRDLKKQVALAKAQAEIQTIQREADAYWDGLYDAIKAVKEILPPPIKENGGAENGKAKQEGSK